MTILDHPLIAQRYFFPRPAPLADPFHVDTGGDARLACHHQPAEPGRRTVVYFHGNGEVVADHLLLARQVQGLDLGVLLAEYRGYGASTGEPRLAAMLDDVDAIHEALGLPEEQLIVFGRSVGSLYAIEYAHRHPGIAGLVLESGIADVLQRVLLRVTPEELGSDGETLAAEAARLFDHEAKLGGLRAPLLVLHAENDHLVDISHAERNHAWAGCKRKRLLRFPRGDHNSILHENWDEYWEAVGAFCESLD